MNTSFERGEKSTDEWYTPKWLIAQLGHFDLDPCAPFSEFYTADKCYTKHHNGLALPWFGRCFVNPPYRNPIVGQFITRLAEHGNGIALVFNRMDTALWHDVIFPTADAMLIIKGRLKFFDQNGIEGNSAGCGSVLVAWGKDNVDALSSCSDFGKFINLRLLFQ